LGCGFFEHTIFTLGYTNAPDTAFWECFLCGLARSKINSIFLFFIDSLFFNNYICKVVQQAQRFCVMAGAVLRMTVLW